MYKQFFGLNENPFNLAPDPGYLFLSKSHEEALAHLRYGILQEEGFISITGVAGVGKTFIAITFIESLHGKIEAAYISNPELSSKQLLTKINQKFKIRSDVADTKGLLDALYQFLMQQKQQGKRVALFIDEAQKLEQDAMEQVRLLSNLETNRDKLLQIVLIGQPELTEMLNSQQLRQIGQRISVSYQINPLTFQETQEYIYHRIKIASAGNRIEFDQAAFRHIYKYSSGVHRLINIACDKTLLTSSIYHQKKVSGDIAKISLAELQNHVGSKWIDFLVGNRTKLIIVGCCLSLLLAFVGLITLVGLGPESRSNEPKKAALINQKLASTFKLPLPYAKRDTVVSQVQTQSIPDGQFESGAALEAAPSQKTTAEHHLSPKMTHSVKVGAFLIKENAERIARILKKKGYNASIVRLTNSKGKVWHTVRIGDYPSREIAKQHADAFSAKEQRESAVVPVNKL
jgi:type II secretory pathway predicted ATPase ExeA